MQLSVAFVYSAVYLLSATASPVEVPRGMKVSISKRTNFAGEDGIVNTTAVQTHVARSMAKIYNGFASYQENTGNAHPYAPEPGIAKREPTVLLTDDQNGQMWQGEISVGTPPQNVSVDFDTGSSDLVLPGPMCGQNCAGHHYYNPSKSSTSKPVMAPFSLSYGDGSSTSGEQYYDNVHVAGFTATNATVGAATVYSEGFAPWNFLPDGLMGMAYKSISKYPADPIFQMLVDEGLVKDAVFAFKLGSNNSELMLGGTNSELYQGDITYAPVTQQGYWQVEMDSVSANDNGTLDKVSAIIDTGTTLVVGDSDSVDKFYASIPGSKPAPPSAGNGFYTVPCNATPDVTLTFGGKAFNISKDLFNLGPASSGSSDCLAGIVGQSGLKFWIVGDMFLQNVYSIFDLQNNRVGFADLA